MGRQIIIVEDDPSISDILKIILERAGYTVIHYTNGLEIIRGTALVPGLYLIDRQLSGIDGLEICRHLKKQQETRDVPIIVLSATPGILHMAKAAGADNFIEKPFAMAKLLQVVARHLPV